jgi:hypothetical protein
MSAERVAELALKALVRSKRDRVLSLGGNALVAMGRWFPNMTDRILAWTIKPPNDSK